MSDTYPKVVELISENYGISAETISLESHLLDDLGLDSVDLFDFVFSIEDTFEISVPTEKWTLDSKALDPEEAKLMVVGAFCERIDRLVASKDA